MRHKEHNARFTTEWLRISKYSERQRFWPRNGTIYFEPSTFVIVLFLFKNVKWIAVVKNNTKILENSEIKC